MAQGTDRDYWERQFMRMVDLVLDGLGGLRQTLSEGEVSEERRARLIRAIDEVEEDYLELGARAVERARQQPPTPDPC